MEFVCQIETGLQIQSLVVATSDVATLHSHRHDLEDLSAAVVEPNVFYEPWLLLPAIEHLGAGRSLVFILIYANDLHSRERLLCGFFPFVRRRRYARVPASVLSLWEYRYCGVCTPLVREGYERLCLQALIHWARNARAGADVIEWQQCCGDGPVFAALAACLRERELRHMLRTWQRPIMLPRKSAEEFLSEALSSNRKRTLRRCERNLAELGRIEFTEMPEGEIDSWIDQFLANEVSGWKGREGVAAVHDDQTSCFLRAALRQAAARNRLLTLALNLAGTPIASRFILTSKHAAFGFKLSYHESYARYSPGSLLEIESIRRLHNVPFLRWLDSCVAPSFTHYLPWPDKRNIADVAFSTGTLRGDAAIAIAPVVRSLKSAILDLKERVAGINGKSRQNGKDATPSKAPVE